MLSDLVVLEAWPVITRASHPCRRCGRVVAAGARMFRARWLDGLYGGFHAAYVCDRCPWPKRTRKPDWRRKVPGRHGPKSAAGKLRCFLARNGLSAEGVR